MGDISPMITASVQFLVPQTGYRSTMPMPANNLRRAPNGVVKDKPIPVRLLPEERAEFVQLAAAEDRSLASVTRLMALRGMAEFKRCKASSNTSSQCN